MFGWRKRIGYIAPTVIEVVAYEFYRFAPEGIGITGVTCSIDDWRPEEFEKGLAQVAAAATYLGSRGVDFIIHGGGPLVVARGPHFEDMIVRDVEAASKVKATTSIRAGMEALRHIKARRIAIASPYPKRHNDALTGHLAVNGFEVLRADGMDLPFKEMQNLPPTDIRGFVAGVIAAAPDCDAIYLPCPQWQAAQIVEDLEQSTGKPVIAYTHACFFVAFRAMGLTDPIRGHGRLLASLAGAA
jgi:maleate cis-trans isomerase